MTQGNREAMSLVLVVGASGALGSRICTRLRANGADVRALLRPTTPAEVVARLEALGVEIARGDVEDAQSLRHAVEGASCVVSTVTSFPRDERPDAIDRVDAAGNIALVDAAEAAGVPRFVLVSFRPIPIDFPLQRAKRAVERRLERAALDAVVLRPGKFMDVWFTPLCGFDPAEGRATLFGVGTSPVTWIAACDVAEIAARSALAEGPRSGVIELGGPEALSQREVVGRFEHALGRKFSLDEIPATQLERQRAESRHPVEESLAALMLETDIGAVIDTAAMLAAFPLELTTVAAFAALVAAELQSG